VPVRIARHLFEDFDAGHARSDPDEEATSEQADSVETVRAAAYAAGYEAGTAAARAQAASDLAALADRLDERLEAASALHRDIMESAADGIARIVLQGFITMLPATMARHGAPEIAEFLGLIKPALEAGGELRLTISAADADAEQVGAVVQRLPPERRARVSVVRDPHLAGGDLDAHWDGGDAHRRGDALRRDIAALLQRHGLMPQDDALLMPA
jgi:hypothetical protein